MLLVVVIYVQKGVTAFKMYTGWKDRLFACLSKIGIFRISCQAVLKCKQKKKPHKKTKKLDILQCTETMSL